MAKMLAYHSVEDGEVSEVRYVAIKDVHRIDACEKNVPAYTQGVRAFIYGRGANAFCYRAHETAEELTAAIEA